MSEVRPVEISQELQTAYLDYAMSVIVARALPDVRDGLKPVQRRILYTMYEMGLGPQSKFRKSSAITGTTMARYHPHGDIPVYDALARMAQDFSLRYPLIDGQGNWGSIDGDRPASQRYTEARLTPLATEMLKDIEKDTVDWARNYDNTRQEPKVLPAAVPQLILNGAKGIAVGMATNIPPHNLGEVIDGLIMLIEKGADQVTTEDLLSVIQGPDFPTGGIVYQQDFVKTYSLGRGAFVVRAKTRLEETAHSKQILVEELPYQVNKADLIAKIAELVKQEKLSGIRDIVDESDRNGVKIIIDLKSGVNSQAVLNQLYQKTALQITYHLNMIALLDGLQPRLLSLKDVLSQFIQHRFRVVKRRTEYLLSKAQKKEHILEGLVKALDNIDAVIQVIKKSKDRNEAFKALKKNFGFSTGQAEAILRMRLQRLSNLETQEIKDQLQQVRQEIAEYRRILEKDANIMQVIKEELVAIKQKYADKRRTRIVGQAIKQLSEKDLVLKKDALLTITRAGRLKRVSTKTYRQQGRGGVGVLGEPVAEGDVLLRFAKISTHDELYFFTQSGRVYCLAGYEVPSKKRTQKGEFLSEQIPAFEKEIVAWVLAKSPGVKQTGLILASRQGKLKRLALKKLARLSRSGLRVIGLGRQDYLARAAFIEPGTAEVLLVSRAGRAIRFGLDQVPELGRAAQGVKGMRLNQKDDGLVALLPLDQKNQPAFLVTLTERGFVKKTPLAAIRAQGRGGKGLLVAKLTKATGALSIAACATRSQQELLIATQKGKIIRLALKDVPQRSRRTQGVRAIKLEKDDQVADIIVM